MRKYNLSILGVSELRWTGHGRLRTSTGESVLFSGSEDRHERGVALFLAKGLEKCLIDWEPVNERIIRGRLYGKQLNTTTIQIYAPTNEADPEDKEEFYEQLSKITEKVPRQDLLIVMGDANAKVGRENVGIEDAMGKEGLGDRNENGDLFIAFCAQNELVIGGTLFKHKNIHKYTWTSPNGHTTNQIDHVAVKRKYRRSVLDVRTMRGADISSDHELVIAKIKIKLESRKRKNQRSLRARYETNKLICPEIRKQYVSTMRKKLDEKPPSDNVEQSWKQLTEAHNETAKTVLGTRKGQSKSWISASSWKAIEDRKKIKDQMNCVKSDRIKDRLRKDYIDKDREVKKRVRADKREMLEEMAKKAEEAAKKNEMGTVYKITNTIYGKKHKKSAGVRTKDGKLLTQEDEVRGRWEEHFNEVLNTPCDIPVDESVEEELQAGKDLENINLEPPTREEVRRNLIRMQNDKAPGIDGITAEMWKADIDFVSN